MASLQSNSAVGFINSLAQRIAARSLASDNQNKKNPSSKKLIAKSLSQITDSQLKETLESNVSYFEKLLDLTIAHHVSESSEEFDDSSARSNNFLCLNAPLFHFKDTLVLSKTTPHATVDALTASVAHTSKCTPQQVSCALASVIEFPVEATTRLVRLLHARMALFAQEWCNSSTAAWESSSFLLAFATSHACCSSPSDFDTSPCWASATAMFQDVSCFTFAGNICYWMLTFSSRNISASVENISVLCSQMLRLLKAARKLSEHLVADSDDDRAPLACLLIQHWVQGLPASQERKMLLREIYSFMRQWEGRDRLRSLWSLLAAACGLDVEEDSELIAAGASMCSGRYVSFSEWFIGQKALVAGAMQSVVAGVSGRSSDGQSIEDDIELEDEIEIMLDGKALNNEDEGVEDEGIEDEGKVEFLDDAEDEQPVTFFLDKRGTSLLDGPASSESSQILADLGDLGETEEMSEKSKKRKSLAVIDEDGESEEEEAVSKKKKTNKTRVKKEKEVKKSTRVSARSTRSSSQ